MINKCKKWELLWLLCVVMKMFRTKDKKLWTITYQLHKHPPTPVISGNNNDDHKLRASDILMWEQIPVSFVSNTITIKMNT